MPPGPLFLALVALAVVACALLSCALCWCARERRAREKPGVAVAKAAPAAETPVETPLVDDGASFFPGGARLSRAHADPDTIDVEVEPVRRREAPRAAAEAPLSELLFCAPTAGESDLQCMTRVLTCSEQGDARLLTCSKDGDTKFG